MLFYSQGWAACMRSGWFSLVLGSWGARFPAFEVSVCLVLCFFKAHPVTTLGSHCCHVCLQGRFWAPVHLLCSQLLAQETKGKKMSSDGICLGCPDFSCDFQPITSACPACNFPGIYLLNQKSLYLLIRHMTLNLQRFP